MNRHQTINGLNRDNDRFFNEKIQAAATIQIDPPIDYGQGFLLFHLQAALGQFKSQTGFLRRLQKARPQSAVHFNSGTDNALRDLVKIFRFVISALSAFSTVNKYLREVKPQGAGSSKITIGYPRVRNNLSR